jgi:ATP-dependent RNA helicase HrpB
LAVRLGALCDAIRKHGLKFIGWSDRQEHLQARIMSLRLWRKNEAWPDVREDWLMENIESWLGPYLNNANDKADLLRLDLTSALKGILPWELQANMEKLAPQTIRVPSGSEIHLRYSLEGDKPVLEVRLQEIFGWLETPRINNNHTTVLLRLLSPGYRIMQVTEDLESFWNSGYQEVRKELRRRYPKHYWPDNPLTAKAVRGVKR